MRKKWIKSSIYLLIVILLLTGCNFLNKSSVSKQTKNQPIENIDFKVNSSDIEKLSLSDFEILNKVDLNIIGLDDKGMFLGLGYGATGDGYREKAVYKFSFDGNFRESIEEGCNTYANAQKDFENNNIYYYFQTNKEHSKVQLMKANYNDFSDQKLTEFDYEDGLLATRNFFVNQQDVYYLNIDDNCLYKKSFSDNVSLKLLDDISEIQNILFQSDIAYIVLSDKCVKIKLKSNFSETLFEGKMIGCGKNEIYYLNKQKEICIYNISEAKTKITGKLEEGINCNQYALNEKKTKIYFTGTKDSKLTLYEYNLSNGENTMRIESQNEEDTFSKPYFIDEWVAVVSYPTSTLYYWNSDKLDTISEVQCKGINSAVKDNSSEAKKRYLLYTFEDEKKLGLLDMENNKNYNIDISDLISETKHPISFWYISDDTIYGQDICDWDLGENDPDKFYKIKLRTLLN